MVLHSLLRRCLWGIVFLLSAQGQILDPLREASLLDDMVCRGDYDAALKLAKRDLLRADLDRAPMTPYLAALFIDTGRLQDAAKALKLAASSWVFSPTAERAAVARERAALLLARGDYSQSASEGMSAYHLSIRDSIYKSRKAYAGSIAAEALLRSGDLGSARELTSEIVKLVLKGKGGRFFVPRVLYTACLVESYGPSAEKAEAICLRGLSLVNKSPGQTRDVSLGYLTLAEVRLRIGDVHGSLDAATQCLLLTNRLFGPLHQDAIEALEILSLANLKLGNAGTARTYARDAFNKANAMFGATCPRTLELTRTLHQSLKQ